MDLLARSRPLLRKHRFQLCALVTIVFVGAGITALLPWPMKLVIDHVLYDIPLPQSMQWLSLILPDNNACLLYTSPSPRDLSTSRMPSSA